MFWQALKAAQSQFRVGPERLNAIDVVAAKNQCQTIFRPDVTSDTGELLVSSIGGSKQWCIANKAAGNYRAAPMAWGAVNQWAREWRFCAISSCFQ